MDEASECIQEHAYKCLLRCTVIVKYWVMIYQPSILLFPSIWNQNRVYFTNFMEILYVNYRFRLPHRHSHYNKVTTKRICLKIDGGWYVLLGKVSCQQRRCSRHFNSKRSCLKFITFDLQVWIQNGVKIVVYDRAKSFKSVAFEQRTKKRTGCKYKLIPWLSA